MEVDEVYLQLEMKVPRKLDTISNMEDTLLQL